MKNEQNITCPSCRHAFPLDLALKEHLRGELTTELTRTFDKRLAQQRKEVADEVAKTTETEIKREHSEEIVSYQNLLQMEKGALDAAHKQLATIRQQTDEQARAEFAAERKGLETELGRQRAALADLRGKEVELRREKTRLEGMRQELEVQTARTLDAERVRLRDELSRSLATERGRVREELASAHAQAQGVREAEHAQQTDGLRRQVEELRRKLEAGGEQRRGEVCEVRLEEFLRGAYPGDTIEPVARGTNGADVCQRVCVPGDKPCGTIIYENKHTVAWNPRWLAKVKDDQRAERAEVAVIVSTVLPKEVSTFALVDGVWVTSFACLPGLSIALRLGLLQLAAHRQAAIGRGEKMELVYAYLTGPQFQRHVESLAATFAAMGDDLAKEKRAITTSWHRREKQLERVAASVTGLYGDLQGIAGAGALPRLEPLELAGLLGDEGAANGERRQATLI